MDDKLMLMIPGPTPVPEQALLALSKHPIGHRSGDFSKIMAEVTENLKWLHQTQNDVQILTASGTGAMEAGIINFLSRGEKVLCGCNGKFGERWAEVATAYGLDVDTVTAEWGQPLDPEQFRAKLEADTNKEIKAVILTHSETSTGVINDLETVNRHVKAHGALMIVDAVTSLGAVNLPIDEWGLDVVASGSQKGYMIPPGLGFVSVSDKAWEAYKTANLPRYYLDLGLYRKSTQKNTTPFTPPVNLFFALQVTLQMMKKEGLENIFARHQRLTKISREAVKALGLSLFAADECASPAITAVAPPEGLNAEDIRAVVKKKFDIVLAGGQDHLKGKIFRIGHLGFVSDRDILAAIASLEAALRELGYEGFTPGAGVAAAARVLAES
ncbi:Soluble hydrogenase 42 kDa subunit [Planktothrix serta PCC 8927]|uniref:Soluble hydrogenase 42 kDa subunit n=1 Tax=Planktothrix serta PCC 8927 TaxID=671068 RepID=A0A7Z9BL07_9CYAN|nr:alanine--glyoxylate aminotransferase family protein [Planktothrix serta]VXD13430.1 Soluble hydrogenase 42 kDa subunit [Planktothrix serta PCC 8927]